jgi:ribosomal protein S18 acetylase RimI-like enzyme
MEFISLQDRSAGSIEPVIEALQPKPEHLDRITTILGKAKNLYLLKHKGQVCGFINIKPHPTKSVIYCPLYYSGDAKLFNPEEVMLHIRQLFPDTKATYCVFMNIFGEDIGYIPVAKAPWDSCFGMKLEAKDIHCNCSQPEQVTCRIEEIAIADLLDLHQKAYASEPEYVPGDWADLLEPYAANPQHLTISCKHNGKLIGACLAFQREAEHYIYSLCVLPQLHGKGIGRYILESYLKLTKSPVYSLSVLANNHTAKKLYEKLGFTRTIDNYAVYKFPYMCF